MNACVGVVAFIGDAIVLDGLSPNLVVGFCVDEFFAFVGAVEVDAVFLFVIAMAQRHEVRLVVHAERDCDVFCGFQNFPQLFGVCDFSVFATNMKRHEYFLRAEAILTLHVQAFRTSYFPEIPR